MFSESLLFALFLALVVSASPAFVKKAPVTVALSRRLNLTRSDNLVRHDQARAKRLKAFGAASDTGGEVVNVPVDNQAVTYFAHVEVGKPATNCKLFLSLAFRERNILSNTWVGANHHPYSTTSTSKNALELVSVTYGSGFFSGLEYTDEVSLVSGLTIPDQSIGAALFSSGFDDIDGILGIGPVNLTVGTLFPGETTPIPTVTDNLYSLGIISKNLIGISYEPTNTEEVMNGQLTWGGVDDSKYTGNITYTPITTTYPASEYWGIDQSIKYGSAEILSTTAGIVDTGTTLILLATDAYKRYVSATGAVLDTTTGLLRIALSQFSNLQNLFFTIGGTQFEFTPDAQIWPRSLNADIGGTLDNVYLIVADLGTNSGEGLDFINGYAFLERFYSVYDTTNRRIGIANTPYTKATSNSYVTG
ncbi:aspartic peptidase domain-containing protein [Crepidotus variabilis]|uniref:Aspartic peptidase domain-containing protein n=1 Tax=Crepidotus variabilis TaxID=179855 RepID=A0A9P6JV85_9AGAR|nr:aspartic peptidase domain-containing protein [Crepidotus variabilis]